MKRTILLLIICMLFSSIVSAGEARLFYSPDDGKVLASWENVGGGSYPLSVEEMKIKLGVEDSSLFVGNIVTVEGKVITDMYVIDNELVINYKDIDTFQFNLQQCEADLFGAFKDNISFPLYYSPIGRCLSYLNYPYTDDGSVSALNTLSAYVNNLLVQEIFNQADIDLFKSILSNHRITLPEEV